MVGFVRSDLHFALYGWVRLWGFPVGGSYCWFKIELTGTAYTHIRIPIPNPEKVEKENEALLDIIPVGRFFLHPIPLLPS